MTKGRQGKRTELRNSAGELVHVTYLPPFTAAPGVLIWGDRLFKQGLDEGQYVEVAYYLVPLKEAWGERSRYEH